MPIRRKKGTANGGTRLAAGDFVQVSDSPGYEDSAVVWFALLDGTWEVWAPVKEDGNLIEYLVLGGIYDGRPMPCLLRRIEKDLFEMGFKVKGFWRKESPESSLTIWCEAPERDQVPDYVQLADYAGDELGEEDW